MVKMKAYPFLILNVLPIYLAIFELVETLGDAIITYGYSFVLAI